MSYRQVVLIRCEPETPAAGALLECAAEWALTPVTRLLFFHGDAVNWVNSAAAGRLGRLPADLIDLAICNAAWQRRQTQPPPRPWLLASLVQFWDAAERAESVLSFGRFDHV